MMIKGKHIIGLLSIVLLSGCIEKYTPEIDQYENALVVDGMITNDEGPYVIRLSRSASLQNPEIIPVEGAEVLIRDKTGNEEILTESEPGAYTTSPDGIKGIVGKSYQLEIFTNNRRYQSEFEELHEPTEIDQITTESEFHPGEEYLHDISGLRFYIDTKEAPNDTAWYMWSLTETYEYKSDYKIRYYWEGELIPFPRPDSLQTCYKSERVPQIFTSRTDGISDPVIRHYPLHYVNTESRKLYLKYNLRVKQFSLNKSSWTFWEEVRKQNETQGGLYDQQPYQIIGNIKNIENPKEPVLGQFTVAGVSEISVFFDRPNLDFWFFKCELTEGDFENFSSIVFYPPESWPIYVTSGLEGGLALPLQECMDCRLKGGDIEAPDFWTDF